MIAARCLVEGASVDTDRNKSIEALRQAEKQLPDVFDTGDVAAVSTD